MEGHRGISAVGRAARDRWAQVEYNGAVSGAAAGEIESEMRVAHQEQEVIDLTCESDGEDNGAAAAVKDVGSSECDTDIDASPSLKREEQQEPEPEQEEEEEEIYSFKLVKSDVYDRDSGVFPGGSPVESRHFITMADILGNRNVKKSVLFSFQYEFDFIFAQFHKDIKSIVMVAQTGTIQPLTTRRYSFLLNRTTVIEISMAPWSCHHTKMIINYYNDDTCRIFLPSNNFTYAETNYPQQVCWCGPWLPPKESKGNNGTDEKINFEENLMTYLKSYANRKVNSLIIADLLRYDFSKLKDVEFIFSTKNKKVTSGLRLLTETLREHDLIYDEGTKDINILCQTSSMGNSLSKATPVNLFTHKMIPLWTGELDTKPQKDNKRSVFLDTNKLLTIYRNRNIKPHIVYPSFEELKSAPAGSMAQGWFNFYYEKNKPYYEMLRDQFKVFYKQDSTRVSFRRGPTPSHSKFYMSSSSTSSSFQQLDWCCYISSNLSVTAWGRITNAQPRNFEVGVLLKRKRNSKPLRCYSFTDVIYNDRTNEERNHKQKHRNYTNAVMVPFTLPVVPYEPPQDQSFNRNVHVL